MTYLEYFNQHPTETLDWCKCYTDKSGEYFLVMYDGEPSLIKTPSGTKDVTPRHCGDDSGMHDFAIAVNNGYHCYHGWTDAYIALDVMHEVGCASCPFRDGCQVMNEEKED